MDEEHIYSLMMDALDDELDEQGSAELQTYLAQNPALAQEWQGIRYIDNLLIATPPIMVPVSFAERTLARLPNPRVRRTFILAFFMLLLFLGLAPMLGLAWVALQSGGPTMFGSFTTSIGELAQLFVTLTDAVFTTIGTVLTQQPILFGWLALMVGIVAVWYSVYQQLTLQPQPAAIALAQTNR